MQTKKKPTPKKFLSVMSLGIMVGDEITVTISGDDESSAKAKSVIGNR